MDSAGPGGARPPRGQGPWAPPLGGLEPGRSDPSGVRRLARLLGRPHGADSCGPDLVRASQLFAIGDHPWFAEYHWHGPQFLVGNLYILVGLLFVALGPIASMNGVAMAAVAGVRRAVARPSARTGLIVTAVVWVITRVPMYLIDTGQGARPPGGRCMSATS